MVDHYDKIIFREVLTWPLEVAKAYLILRELIDFTHLSCLHFLQA